MYLEADYIVVGSGLTGSVLARLLRDAGKEVLVLERRSHVGGNVHDHSHPCGIRIHTYGPHYFRTESEHIWRFVNRFADFFPYNAVVKILVDGRIEQWPLSRSFIAKVGDSSWTPDSPREPANFEEAALQMMPREIYRKCVQGYSEKQWGAPAQQLSAELAGRFEVREEGDDRLKKSRYQGLPANGYAAFMTNMLQGIPVLCNFDYLERRGMVKARHLLIFTGCIDAYFDYCLGRLAYRGQLRHHSYLPDCDRALPCGQVNDPSPEVPYVRTLEWKHMMPGEHAQRIRGTVLTTETPCTPVEADGCEYVFPDGRNSSLYQRYRELAAHERNILICGRLGEYRYYDMDHAIEKAMTIFSEIILAEGLKNFTRAEKAAGAAEHKGIGLFGTGNRA
jgi:UDP-galactopyranose mutase